MDGGIKTPQGWRLMERNMLCSINVGCLGHFVLVLNRFPNDAICFCFCLSLSYVNQNEDLLRGNKTSHLWVAIDSDYDNNLFYVIDRQAQVITVRTVNHRAQWE